MSELLIRYSGTQSQTSEYGYPMEATDSFLTLVPESMHGGSVDIALGVVRNSPSMTDAAQVVINTSVRLQDGSFRVTGTRTRLNAARRQDNFRFVYHGSLTSGETAIDLRTGGAIAVSLDEQATASESIQIQTLSRDNPLFDISCVGIRDITPIGTPARLQSLWLGGVNSGIFNGFENANIGAGGVICSEVSCEPHFVNDTVQLYRIQFRFIGSMDGWRQYIYWKDPSTGLPPDDMTPANWSRLIQLYNEFDFQAAWPFGDDVGE